MKIGIIGCGHMGSAIAKALMVNKIATVRVSSPQRPKFKISWTIDNRQIVKGAHVIIIAVKPNVVMAVLQEIAPLLKSNQILISIAAGVPLKKLAFWSGGHKKIVRMMPNLPAQVFDGMSVWKAASGLKKQEKTTVVKILNSFGKQIHVNDEKLIDVATAIVGGGPAYAAAFLESMAKAAQKIGFSKNEARILALQTVDGSLDYIEETGIGFNNLKQIVQTKGGTTEAGFKILKKKKWQATLEQALFAGYKRAQQISKG